MRPISGKPLPLGICARARRRGGAPTAIMAIALSPPCTRGATTTSGSAPRGAPRRARTSPYRSASRYLACRSPTGPPPHHVFWGWCRSEIPDRTNTLSGFSHKPSMHDWCCWIGRDSLDVLRRERLRQLRPKSFGPGLGPQVPRRQKRMILGRPRPILPDVHDFNHFAFTSPWTASPRRAEDEALFTGQSLGPLPFSGGNGAICLRHRLL